MVTKARRRQRIRDLLGGGQIASQEQLQSLLAREGLEVTQATLSRDLRDLGVSKGPAGYRLPEAPVAALPGVQNLERLLPAQLMSIDVGGNLIVLKTLPGHANPLAIEIDKSGLSGVIGTVAGDDTVFVATKSAHTKRVFRQFQAMAGWSGRSSSR